MTRRTRPTAPLDLAENQQADQLTDEELGEELDSSQIIGDLRRLASEAPAEGETPPLAAGTFAAYPLPNGGIHLVAQIQRVAPGSPVKLGEFRRTLPPGLLRAMAVAANAGGGFTRALGIGRGRRGR